MKMGIEVTRSAGLIVLVLLVSACSSSDTTTSRSGASWAQNLNEPPPSRQPAGSAASRLKADLNAAREKASH